MSDWTLSKNKPKQSQFTGLSCSGNGLRRDERPEILNYKS